MDSRTLRHRFLSNLVTGLRVVWPVLSGLLALIAGLGFTVGRVEGWSIGASIYFAFVSGLTIGYGDLAPTFPLGRVLAVLIGLCGVLFTALLAAIAVEALASARNGEEE